MSLNTLSEKMPEMNRNTSMIINSHNLRQKNLSHDISTGCLLANAQNHIDIQI